MIFMRTIRSRMKGFDMNIDMLAILVVFILVAFIVWYALSRFKLI